MVLPSNKCGGMERVLINIANYLAADNVNVSFIFMGKGDAFYKLDKKIEVYDPDFENKNKLYKLFGLLFFLRKTIKSIHPHAILSFGEMYNSFVLLSCIGTKQRVFVSDRSKPNKDWGIFHNLLRKILYKKATGIIAQTSFAKDFIFKETKNKNITVIGNPIKAINHLGKEQRTNKIIYVGRLIKSKRVDLLMDIFLKTDNDFWLLQIVGDGPEKEYLEGKVKKMGVTNKIVFEGSQNEINKYYLTSSIFVFASNSEGFPNAIGEAMSAGLPIVCFNCIAGTGDLVKDGVNGFLIENDDVEDFTKKLSLLMSNPELRDSLGKESLLLSKKFDNELISKAYFDFLIS
jgi:glycosyltransferase involved in cell wall biosynthesis